ncbi:MAG: N-acetylmuramoyl-L-alanine amidase, partial [Enterobacterales bacterium]
MLLKNSVHCFKNSIQIKMLVKFTLTILFLFSGFDVFSAPSYIEGIRFWQSPDKTRVVFDMSASSEHKLIVLKNPHRVVIDIKSGKLNVDLSKVNVNSTLIERIRTSQSSETGKLRVVLDLKRAVIPNSFTLTPIQDVGHRLVLDLKNSENKSAINKAVTRASELKKKFIFVVIDAGHGGEDPGASGQAGSREKSVTLSIAKKLAATINKQTGMRAELSRTGDYYLSLKKRTKIARDKGADLFISIHADAFKSRKVRGSSVWILSAKGAKSEVGLWLEKRENDADLLGGVDSVALDKYEPEVAEVLLKIQTERSVRLSRGIAGNIISELDKIMVMHNKKPREAAFVVLKNPAIPSILIETGFISNPNDEKNLRSRN